VFPRDAYFQLPLVEEVLEEVVVDDVMQFVPLHETNALGLLFPPMPKQYTDVQDVRMFEQQAALACDTVAEQRRKAPCTRRLDS
jgi:hypothetical protein